MLFHRVGGDGHGYFLGSPRGPRFDSSNYRVRMYPDQKSRSQGAGCRVIVDNCCHLLPANCDLVYAGGEEKSYFAANEDVQG
jgi:hypothetical protein